MQKLFSLIHNLDEKGFNLVEIVVATGIISLSLVSIIAIAGRSIAVSHRALNTYTAALLLEEGAEATRIVRDDSWSAISGLTAGDTYYPVFDSATNTWSLSTNPSDGEVGMYTRSIIPLNVLRNAGDDIDVSGTLDTGTRFFTENISWRESNGQMQSKTESFYLSDIFS